MLCDQCGATNPPGSLFCAACGLGLRIACATCGHRALATDRYCNLCGGVLRQSSQANPERKQATVLFADIAGSTDLIAGLDAEGAMNRLQPVVAAMVQAVHRFDGRVLRTLGDGVKALFGAGRAQDGHAVLACKAALAIREAVSGIPGATAIRIGLHSGEVVAGDFDFGVATEYDAVGMTVHVASRVEQHTPPGEICLSRECRDLVRAYCDTAPLGQHTAKGMARPLELHRLFGLKPAIASAQFRGDDLAAFRGRAAELAVLERAFAAAAGGEGSAIGIVAPPGSGKSRLCFEFSEWCRQRGVEVLEARVLAYAHATPLQLVLDLLRSLFRISPLDDAAGARQRIAGRLAALELDVSTDLPLLAHFLGVAEPGSPVAAADPRAQLTRLRLLLHRLARAAGRVASVVVIEDLHWLDQPSTGFVEMLVDAVAGTHMLLVLNYRPQYRADWMDRPHYHELALPELDAAQMGVLVAELTGAAPELAGLRSRIAARSGGNPFFAEELVRSLTEEGVLEGERGGLRRGAAAEAATLPATIEAVIGARIDTLRDAEKRLIQVGAVIGKEFSLAVARRVTAFAETDIEGMLLRLCDGGLLYEQATVAGRSFAFRHPLIQEVAYAMQLRARRAALHQAVAEALEQFDWGLLDEAAGILAYHYEAAGDLRQAAIHLQRAARWLGRTNCREAFQSWKRVRTLLRALPASAANDQMRAVASGQILFFGWREGIAGEEAKAFADEALHYARAGGGGGAHVPLLLGGYGRLMAATGGADDYVAVAREALALTAQAGDASVTQAAGGMLSQAYYYAGRLRESLAANDAALAISAGPEETNRIVTLGMTASQMFGFDIEQWVKCYRTMILVRLGRFEEADSWCARVMQFDPAEEDYVVQFIPHVAQVELAAWRGDGARAERHAALVVDCAEKSRSRYMISFGRVATALARRTAGDFEGAARILTDELATVRDQHAGRELEAWMLAELACAQLEAGDAASAAATAADAIDVAQRRAHRLAALHASITRARALSRLPPGADAHEPARLLAQARHLIDLSGARIFERPHATARAEVETARH